MPAQYDPPKHKTIIHGELDDKAASEIGNWAVDESANDNLPDEVRKFLNYLSLLADKG